VDPAAPMQRYSLLDDITGRILALIRDEGLDPGSRLPATAELAERFGVATPTLREALRRLESTGVVEIRHGSGVYFRGDLSRLVLANPHRAKLTRATLLDLLDTRAVIEPYLAEQAARCRGENEARTLDAAFARIESVLDGSPRALSAANMAFHAAIGHISGNRVLSQVLDTLIELNGDAQVEIMHIHGDMMADFDEHRRILANIKAGKPLRARDLMRKHLLGVRDIVDSASEDAVSPRSSRDERQKRSPGVSDDERR
jgi:GntR family transcriptional regulator, transcriptional repressor for pyruvate dehydrogenase complex